MLRKVFTEAAFDVEVGQLVGDVTWERVVPGNAWRVLSRGFDHEPTDGHSRGMWLKLELQPPEALQAGCAEEGKHS